MGGCGGIVWINCGSRDGGVEVDIAEVFVEVDAISCVLGGGGEREHEVRDGPCPRVQNPKATGV